jgi:hypothetical protein
MIEDHDVPVHPGMNITNDGHGQTFGIKLDADLTVGGNGLIRTGIREARERSKKGGTTG